MSGRAPVVVAVALTVAVLAGGLLFVDGWDLGGTPNADGSTTTTESSSAVGTTLGSDSSPATGDADGDESATTDYGFTIERIEPCGNTCRNVTARLSNEGAMARRNVRVTTRVLADGDLLWAGNESVGRLGPGESYTSTRRVELGFTGGLKVSANDGYVTVVTVVRSDAGTARFEDRRKVG